MPELFRLMGFKFLFHSREHGPIHIHVDGKDGYAKFNLEDGGFVLDYSDGISPSDLNMIKEIVEKNKDLIIIRWNEYFSD